MKIEAHFQEPNTVLLFIVYYAQQVLSEF